MKEEDGVQKTKPRKEAKEPNQEAEELSIR